MFRQTTSWVLALILPVSMLLQACGKQPTTPNPSNGPLQPPTSASTIGTTVVTNACAAQGDVDSDKDGICDKQQAKAMGPGCVNNPDCDGDGIPNGDDENWMDNPWVRAGVIFGAAALAYTARSCINGQPGCDFWPFNDGSDDATTANSGNQGSLVSISSVGATGSKLVAPTFASYSQSTVKFSKAKGTGHSGHISLFALAGSNSDLGAEGVNLGKQISICINSDYIRDANNYFQLVASSAGALEEGLKHPHAIAQTNCSELPEGIHFGTEAGTNLKTINPAAFGFSLNSGGEMAARPSRVAFDTLDSENAVFHFEPSNSVTGGNSSLYKIQTFTPGTSNSSPSWSGICNSPADPKCLLAAAMAEHDGIATSTFLMQK